MEKLKVGIAGYGVVGERRHVIINSHDAMQVVAIADKKLSNDFESKDYKIFQNYEDLFSKKLDVLFICLPNDVAPKATIEALEKNMHVFCEKPPGRTVMDIRDVREVESKHPQLKLKYGFNHRYHDSVREALKIIKNGDMGKVINLRGVYGKSEFIPWPRPSAPGLNYTGPKYWRTNREIAGGGILLDQGIHMVDLIRVFAGEFTEIKSFISNDYWKHDVEDNAFALMKNNEGVVAMLHSTATQWRHRFKLEIFLEQGALILSGILSGSKSYGDEKLTVVYREENVGGNPREQTMSYIRDNSWKDEIYEFADCIINNRPVAVGSSYDALKTMELVYNIYCADSAWKNKFNLTVE